MRFWSQFWLLVLLGIAARAQVLPSGFGTKTLQGERGQTFLRSGSESGGFNPRTISGLTLWVDASQVSGVTNGAAVSVWPDLSGAGNDLTQPTGSLQPLFNVAVQNGKAAMLFDGSNDRMDTTAALSSLITASAGWVFAVVKPTAVTSAGVALTAQQVFTSTSGGFFGLSLYTNSGTGLHYARAYNYDGTYDVASTLTFSDQCNLLEWGHGGGNVTVGREGSTNATASGNTSSLTDVLRIGHTYNGTATGYKGYICEVLVFNRELTEIEKSTVRVWLQAKWRTVQSPLDVSGLTLWVDASRETRFTNSQPTADWFDFSGAGVVVTQATGGLQPIYTANVQNGKAAMLFDGSNDRIDTTAALSSLITSSNGSVFAVVKPTAVTSADVALTAQQVFTSTSGGFFGLSLYTNSGTGLHYARAYNYDGTYDVTGNVPITVGAAALVEWSHRDGSLYGTARSVSETVASGNTSSLTDVLRIGHTYNGTATGYKGYICELWVFSTAPTTAQRTMLEAYARTKWALP